jgi:MFS superfamily sulfate permease-like transporter
MFSRVAWFRVVVASLVLGSLLAAWWSITQVLLPVQRQCKESSAKVSRLATDVDELQRACSRENLQQTRARVYTARARLFSDETSLANWLTELQAQASPLNLQAQASFGKTQPLTSDAKGLLLIPTTIELGVLPVGDARNVKGTVSQRLANLMRQLESGGKRADLTELTVTGNGYAVEHSTLVVNLWAEQEVAR